MFFYKFVMDKKVFTWKKPSLDVKILLVTYSQLQVYAVLWVIFSIMKIMYRYNE